MIHVDYRDSKPMYEQVKTGFRRLIVQGFLEVDEKLPSVRELASSLAINPNTIQRAYRELENEGFVYTVAGRGSFVAGVPQAESVRKQELMKQFEEITEELFYLGASTEELVGKIMRAGESHADADGSHTGVDESHTDVAWRKEEQN